MTKGVSLAKEGDPNRGSEVATVDISESPQFNERLSMVAIPDSAATSCETSIGLSH